MIGPGGLLMVDANQLWDLPTARRAAAALAPFDIYWLEEPLPAEDIQAYARLRAAIDIPVAAGESLYTEAQFRDVLLAGAVDYLQPNICRVGGITPFLRIAQLARTVRRPGHAAPAARHLRAAGAVPAAAGHGRGHRRGLVRRARRPGEPSGVTISRRQLRAGPAPGTGWSSPPTPWRTSP